MNPQHWKDQLGDWDEDDPATLAWYHKKYEPVIAKVDGTLKLYSSGLVMPISLDMDEFVGTLQELGEPRIEPLSANTHRFNREMWEWER